MFSRLNVRTKLLVMTLPAALGLCGLAGSGVQTRLDARGDAERSHDAVAIASVTADVVHELQHERLLAATAAARPNSRTARDLSAQSATTNRAADALAATLVGPTVDALDTLGGAAGEDLARELTVLRARSAALEDVRTSAAGDTPERLIDAYTTLIDDTMTAASRLEAATGRSGDADSRRWLAQGIEAESAAAATAARLLPGAATDDTAGAAEAAREHIDHAGLYLETYRDDAGDAGGQRLDDARATAGSIASDDLFAELASGTETFSGTAATWPDLARARNDALSIVERESFASDLARLDAAAADADSAALIFAGGAAAICMVAFALAVAVSRNITGTLRRLTDSARVISTEQVPALVHNLKTQAFDPAAMSVSDVDTGTTDEFAAVGAALNDLSRAMVTVASEQQASLRKGISDIFVNLARRNQTLLDRQIQFIDRLEENEQDPDQLESLFRLDHLATRMRRNAESLLVLAGAEAPRRRARDVELADVIRVAVGEVEDFARVSLLAVEDAHTVGGAAVDIAHLLAELMENGAQYSPPEKTVDVVGHRTVDGGYTISITDFGVGMTAERLVAANALLASPPPVGLALSRALGFVVAGTLAARHGIVVRLSASPTGGVTAEVALPAALVVAPDSSSDERSDVVAVDTIVATSTGFDESSFVPLSDQQLHQVPADKLDSVLDAALGLDAGSGFTAGLDEQVLGAIGPGVPADGGPSVVTGWTAAGEYVEYIEYADVEPADAFDPRTEEPVTRSSYDPTAPAVPPPYVPAEPIVAEWSEERLPSSGPMPSKLSEILPEGVAFEQGLYSLLDRDAPHVDPTDEHTPGNAGSPSVDGAALPQRAPGASALELTAGEPEARTAPTDRAPDEVRSLLSRYRDGLHNGRAAGATSSDAPTPAPPPAPTTAPTPLDGADDQGVSRT